MHHVKRGFQNVRLEAKHTWTTPTSATVHNALLCRRSFALVSLTSRSSVGKCVVHPIHQLLSRYSFLFFTERLYWARLHPWQASDMNTFIVLFFRLLFLSQHLLSGFIMDRRIPWRKANCIGVFYFRLVKQASSAHLNAVNHFTFM